MKTPSTKTIIIFTIGLGIIGAEAFALCRKRRDKEMSNLDIPEFMNPPVEEKTYEESVTRVNPNKIPKQSQMEMQHLKTLEQLISNCNEEEAKYVSDTLAKKYPLIMFDALSERFNTLDVAMHDMSRYMKGI